ncbi:hypothetical protein GW17_00053106, partial [Ensete ventricosum]
PSPSAHGRALQPLQAGGPASPPGPQARPRALCPHVAAAAGGRRAAGHRSYEHHDVGGCPFERCVAGGCPCGHRATGRLYIPVFQIRVDRMKESSVLSSRDTEYLDHNDTLVILVCIGNAKVKRVMVDIDSLADVLYHDAFLKLGLTATDLTLMSSMLIEFMGDSITPLRITLLPITLGQEPRSKTMMVTFMVVNLPLAHNVILNRPTLNKLRAVISTYH